MRITQIKDVNRSPLISPERFVSEHFFIFLVKGKMSAYDGSKHYDLFSGESGIMRKNNLARYNKEESKKGFEKIVITFEEPFLKKMLEKYPTVLSDYFTPDSFLRIKKNKLLSSFVTSLLPYYNEDSKIDKAFLELKQEELLRIILKLHPEFADVLFDFGKPDKIDLEAFMNKNFKFNVPIDRFAYLTGRSLSAFKRDFAEIFNETPNRWLVKKRLQEAYFLIEKKGQKPTDIYLDLGFLDLSHFYFAFKKEFGLTPSEVYEQTANE